MGVAAAIETASAGGAGDEAELDEERFDHVLDRVAWLAEASGKGFNADRATAVEIGDHGQVAAVHRVEAERIDLEPRQGAIGDLSVDIVGARGVGKIAYAAKEAAGDSRRPARAAGDAEVDAKVADAALTRMEVDQLGLDAMDRRYLLMIADIYRGGPVGVETLAAGLSEPRDTIEEVIEPFLIQLGLVARTARGRCLNGPAWAHLGLPQPKGQGGLFDGK